jgi:tetratricopeptide (TPR) repeat protein
MEQSTHFDRLLAAGMEASRGEDRETALSFFSQAVAADPGSAFPHFLIASEHASAGNVTEAELGYARAVLLSPGFPLARYQLGLLQFTSQKAPLALITWQPLLQLPETDALLHFVRGFMSLAQDAFQDTLQHLRAGLACGPANPPLRADILQLVDAVDRLHAAQASPSSGHILLSAYAGGVH